MAMIVILMGVLGLGIVILVHELGHYAAARAAGVEVEAFSIGWGPKIAGWKRGPTEWRISAIPLGGYCKMKGEEAFAEALQNKSETISRDPGTFYGTPAWKRILISVSGPLANVLLAFVIFVVVGAIGSTALVQPNRIVLAADFPGAVAQGTLPERSPAQEAGLKTGDRIIQIDSKPIADFNDIVESVVRSPGKALALKVERDGAVLDLTATPMLNKSTGAGILGIYSYLPLEVAKVKDGSPASLGGLRAGDRIISLDGSPISFTSQLAAVLAKEPARIQLGVDRAGETKNFTLILDWTNKDLDLGLSYTQTTKVYKAASFGAAIKEGAGKTWSTFVDSLKGMALLFKGVDITKAISGPFQIIDMAGSTAVNSVEQNGISGLTWYFDFLGLISIALFIMNLLPIPALDGGMIVLFVAEILKGKPLKVMTIYRYQIIGMVFILALFVLAMFSDGNHFLGRFFTR